MPPQAGNGAAPTPTAIPLAALDEKLQFLIKEAAERCLAAKEAMEIAKAMEGEARSELLVYLSTESVGGRAVEGEGWRVSPVKDSKRETLDRQILREALVLAGVPVDKIVDCITKATKTSPVAATVRVTPKGGGTDA